MILFCYITVVFRTNLLTNVQICPTIRGVMEIGVKQAAKLLKVADKTIYRWVQGRQIPFYRVGNQYRFSRSELLSWVSSHSTASASLVENKSCSILLAESLRAGGIFYRVGGHDVRSVLEEIVGMMKLPKQTNLAQVVDLLCKREKLATTGMGEGIAFPHCRDITLPGLTVPMVSLAFLEQPIDFLAIDANPVHTVFTLLSPTSQSNIRLMSRLAYAVRISAFSTALKEVAPRSVLFDVAEQIDRELNKPNDRKLERA